MPRNAAGNYTLPESPVVTSTTIESSVENNTNDDIGSELTNSLDRSGRGGMLAALRLADGTLALPGLAFVLDTNTGIYRSAADTMVGVAGGVAVWTLTTTAMTLHLGATLTGHLLFTDNTYDIGASGATRPRTGYFGTSMVVPTIGPVAAQQHTLPAVASDTVALLAAAQTFTNKTLTAPIINTAGPNSGQQHTLPAVASDTFVLLAAAQTLTNKTLTSPVLGGTVTGTYTLGGTPSFPNSVMDKINDLTEDTDPDYSADFVGTYDASAGSAKKVKLNILMPPGAVIPFAGTTEPSGWLFCYGQAVSRATYSRLFTAISTTYGVGDGSTTFNLPDLRGRVVAGQDDMGGVSADRLTGLSGGVDGDTLAAAGGLESYTIVTANLPATISVANGVDPGTGSGAFSNVAAGRTNGTGAGCNITISGGGTAHNIVQPTLILNYIIKV